MKEKDLMYYDQVSCAGIAALFIDIVHAQGRIQRVARLHRLRDYVGLLGDTERLHLHGRLNQILMKGSPQWAHRDFGENYFYQGLRKIGITGLRDTEARVKAMNLKHDVAGKRILEIGCNSGFLTLAYAAAAENVTAFDYNPFLIEIAQEVARYLGIQNVSFHCESFAKWPVKDRFEVVISFGNHQPRDGGMDLERSAYFRKCADLLEEGGMLLFESHPLAQESEENLSETVRLIESVFEIKLRRRLAYGNLLDQNRTFMVGMKR